ncbi:MAG: hypothetical protein EB069_07195 [Actinobacteria bacterium]|nr:hypothetical protein [Actinomycetota bacterium]
MAIMATRLKRQPFWRCSTGSASKTVREFVEKQNGRHKLFFLPPYSPHLNSDEVGWAHVKREISRTLVRSKDEMKQFALSALRPI